MSEPKFDPDEMRQIIEEIFTPRIVRQHGSAGADRLKELLIAVRRIYRHRSAEEFGGGLTVLATVDGDPLDWEDEGIETNAEALAEVVGGGGVVQVMPNGTLWAWPGVPEKATLKGFDESAVVYLWRESGEFFLIEGTFQTVRNPNGHPSAIAPPTFFALAKALDYYEREQARWSTCHLLRQAWHDSRHVFLVNKPEKIMRGSLAQHLETTLRDHAEVREEQNVSETQPIDIKVKWSLSAQLSLIEIKWLGQSVSTDGTELATSYGAPARPRAGAKQLADYLEENKQRTPDLETEGYLVVYDARRANVKAVPAEISDDDAVAFRDAEIEYNPDYEAERSDFREPRRFWLEPKLLAG